MRTHSFYTGFAGVLGVRATVELLSSKGRSRGHISAEGLEECLQIGFASELINEPGDSDAV
jgi:hypothetical protein